MSNETPDDLGEAGLDPESIDTGPPIPELAELGLAPKTAFLERLRGRIGRRMLAGQVTDFATQSPLQIFLEFLAILFGGLSRPNSSAPRPDRRNAPSGGSD